MTKTRIWLFGLLTVFALPAMGKTIDIGLQVPLSGDLADQGQATVNAVKLLADHTNAEGGLLGRQIKLITCDDKGETQAAINCAHQLVNDNVFAVIGSITSGATGVTQAIYDKAHILQTSDGSAEELTLNGYRLFFRNSPSNNAQARFAARYLVNGRQFKRIAVLSDHSSYSKGLADAVVAEIKRIHGNVAYQGLIKSGQHEFRDALNKVAQAHADALFFAGYFPEGGRIRAEEARRGIKAAFVGGDANEDAQFIKLAGSAAQGSIIINLPAPKDLPYPEAKQFLAAYQSAYGSIPSSISTMTNADGMLLLMDGIRKTESLNPVRVANFLHQRYHYVPYVGRLNYFVGTTGPFGFNMFGDRFGSPYRAFEIQKDGSYKAIYP